MCFMVYQIKVQTKQECAFVAFSHCSAHASIFGCFCQMCNLLSKENLASGFNVTWFISLLSLRESCCHVQVLTSSEEICHNKYFPPPQQGGKYLLVSVVVVREGDGEQYSEAVLTWSTPRSGWRRSCCRPRSCWAVCSGCPQRWQTDRRTSCWWTKSLRLERCTCLMWPIREQTHVTSGEWLDKAWRTRATHRSQLLKRHV